MEYVPLSLQSPLYGLTVTHPVGQEATAILEGLSEEYDIDRLRPILDEIKEAGVQNVVVDLSRYSSTHRNLWLAFLNGALEMIDFQSRYFGIRLDEVSRGEPEPSFRRYITPKIAESLDAAVESLSR